MIYISFPVSLIDMMRRITAIGLAIILIAIALVLYGLFVGSGQVYNSAVNLTSSLNATVKPHGTYTMAFNYSNGTSFYFLAHASGNINFYLMNSSAYGLFENSNSTSKYANAESLEGKGMLQIYRNATNSSFPASYQQGLRYEYAKNQTQPPKNGIYYLIADNTNGSASASNSISLGIVYLQNFYHNQSDIAKYQKFVGAVTSEKLVGVAGGVFLIFGIVIVAYGFIRRRGKGGDTSQVKKGMSEEEIDRLYETVKRNKTEVGRTPKKRKRRTVKKGNVANTIRKKRRRRGR